MLGSSDLSGRNFYGKLYSAYIKGCKSSSTTNNVTYNLNSTAAGATKLAITSSSSAGGVAATSPSHSGTVYDPSYVT